MGGFAGKTRLVGGRVCFVWTSETISGGIANERNSVFESVELMWLELMCYYYMHYACMHIQKSSLNVIYAFVLIINKCTNLNHNNASDFRSSRNTIASFSLPAIMILLFIHQLRIDDRATVRRVAIQ